MSIVNVAKRAGVSNATVSRVINKHPSVSPETQLAVQTAMNELGFVASDRRPGPKPNSRSRRPLGLCFLVQGTAPTFAPPGFLALLRGVEAFCAERSIPLSLKFLSDEAAAVKAFSQDSPSGLLLHGEFPDGELTAKLRRMPCVWLMANPVRPTWGDQIMPNDEQVGVLAAQYLIAKKHRYIAFINLRRTLWAFRKREDAFISAARKADVDVQVISEALPSMNDARGTESIQKIVERVAALSRRPTGIFVADDRQMSLLHPALLRKRLISKSETDLVSCNHELPYIEGLNPRPATIDIQFETIARFGVQTLLWRIENPGSDSRVISTVEPRLIPPG